MPKRQGFTLIELLVVVAIIALLVAILVPVVTKAVEQGRIAVCGSNLHQIMVAMRMYYDTYQRVPPDWPPAVGGDSWSQHSGWTMVYSLGGTVATAYAPAETYTGLGLLFGSGYATAPGIYWCPSTSDPWLVYPLWIHKAALYDPAQEFVVPGLNEGVPFKPGASSSYVYRKRTGYNASGDGGPPNYDAHEITINDWSSDLSAVTDQHFYPLNGTSPDRSLHKTGFNAAYWDSSVSWVADLDASHSIKNANVSPLMALPEDTLFWLADNPTNPRP